MRAGDERENLNPQVFAEADQRKASPSDWDDAVRDPFDAREVFDLIRGIRDPEHPLTLEQLNVVSVLHLPKRRLHILMQNFFYFELFF